MAEREKLECREVKNEWSDPLEYWKHCLSLGSKFDNPPKVELVLEMGAKDPKIKVGAVDVATSTAVQCYAPGVAAMRPRPEEKFQAMATSTLDAGHHTTRMHKYYDWQIVGISRSVIHDFFHAHPFYNSEQQSQRYVEAKKGSYLMPSELTEEQRRIFIESADFANSQYFELLAKLKPEVERRMGLAYPAAMYRTEKKRGEMGGKADKLAQEIARYVLPIGQLSTMFHTLDEIQLIRLFRASQLPQVSDEARYVVAKMIETVAKDDPSILTELRKPVTRKSEIVIKENYITEGKEEFDEALGERMTTIKTFDKKTRRTVADAVRNVVGVPRQVMSDKDALLWLMDPENNEILADVFETGINDPLTNCLRMANVTFTTRLSHTADSQRQRQRGTPGATPSIEAMYDGKPDYFIPMIVRENSELLNKYEGTMSRAYDNVERCIEAGILKKSALLLLPNAHNIRLTETGDLFNWLHRFKQRLCFLAQEEIFFISVEQAGEIVGKMPEAEKMLAAPCGVRQRAGVGPRCPEGNRWCGQPVFNWKLDQYRKGRLI